MKRFLPGCVLLMCAGAALAEDAPSDVKLPPLRQRPVVVIDKLQNAGLLLPSVQETVKLVVLAINARYGNGTAVLEDEAFNIKKLRSMSRGYKMPESQEQAQRLRLAILDWAAKEAPFRVRATFVFDKKKQAYVSAVECHKNGEKTAEDRAEGVGKGYESALSDLQPKLKKFCSALDTAVADQRKAPPRYP